MTVTIYYVPWFYRAYLFIHQLGKVASEIQDGDLPSDRGILRGIPPNGRQRIQTFYPDRKRM